MSAGHLQRAPKATLRAVFDRIQDKHGSVGDYLEGIGFSRSMQSTVRELLLAPEGRSRL